MASRYSSTGMDCRMVISCLPISPTADDLIIQKTMALLYGLDRSDRKKFMADIHRIAEDWRPYRTYACLHLWNWNDDPQK
ncbi:MAG: hypothetical protein IBJ09_10240 [Bacteroidia bacterium]|nr:hypothetical protein [Bacteroidia bacterium]